MIASHCPFPTVQDEADTPPFIGRTLKAGCNTSYVPQVSATSEQKRLTEEYDSEAARLAGQLDLCGIQHDQLSSQARINLRLLATIASNLQLAEAKPELILAAWAVTLVKQSKLIALQYKLQQETDAIVCKRQATQAKLKGLQQCLHDVVEQQKQLGSSMEKKTALAEQLRQKRQEYQYQTQRCQKKLANNGFSPQLSHPALLDKHEQVAGLQQRLQDFQAQLDSYHHLPVSLLGARMMLQQSNERLRTKQDKLSSRLADMH